MPRGYVLAGAFAWAGTSEVSRFVGDVSVRRWVTAAGVAFVGPGRGRWPGTAGSPVGVIGGKLAAGEARQRRVGRERGSRTPGTNCQGDRPQASEVGNHPPKQFVTPDGL